MAQLRPPIFVADDTGLTCFRDRAHVMSYCEAIDVRNGEYGAAYDADGRLCRLEVDATDAVVVRVLEDEPHHAEELRRALVAALGHDGSLAELVRDMLAYAPP